MVCKRFVVLLKRNWLVMMWLFCFSKVNSSELMVFMLVVKLMFFMLFLSSVILCFSVWLVGLFWCVQMWLLCLFWNIEISLVVVLQLKVVDRCSGLWVVLCFILFRWLVCSSWVVRLCCVMFFVVFRLVDLILL